MNKSKGITLIALTITIVIMLILLGVTVTLFMSGRLIQNANFFYVNIFCGIVIIC